MRNDNKRAGLARGGIARQLSERATAGQATLPGDLASKLRAVFDQVSEALSGLGGQEGAALRHEGEMPFDIGGKAGRAVFGYTVRMGLDGLQAEPFGDVPPAANRKPGAQATSKPQPAARAPITDVFEETDGLRIVVELPGVAAAEVVCALHDQHLHIETKGDPHYAKTLTLPAAVDPASLTQSCSNGILEVRLRALAAP